MEPKGSLLCSQQLAACSYPEPDQSNALPTHVIKTHYNIILPPIPRSYKWSPSIQCPHQNPVCTSFPLIHATFPAHLIKLDMVAQIFGEEHKS